MRANWLLFFALFAGVVGLAASPFVRPLPGKHRGPGKASPRKFVDGELLVKFRKTHSFGAGRSKLINRFSARSVKAIGRDRVSQVKLRSGQRVQDALKEYAQDDSVEYVQPNYLYHLTSTTPDDPSFSEQWGLNNTGQTVSDESYSTNNPGTSGKDMGLPSAWDKVTDCSSVIVAVIDTGVNYNHEDLENNMWDGDTAHYPNYGYDFVDNDANPMDLNGHGTHVAGTIAAEGDNALGGTGVCWRSKIMALRIFDAAGGGATSANLVSAIDFAVANGAKVINLSLGGSESATAESEAIDRANTAGVLIVAAAGNEGTNNEAAPVYPCNYTQANVLCVAALDQAYSLASFSNYGLSSVDVGAPGTNVYSSWNGTHTVTSADDMTTSWTIPAGWGHQQTSILGYAASYHWLTSPSNFDGTTQTYANGLDAQAYKTFDLAGYDGVALSYYSFVKLVEDEDYLVFAHSSAGGNPFTTGTSLFAYSGDYGDDVFLNGVDMKNCISSTCSIGFRMYTAAAGSANTEGVGILVLQFDKVTLTTSSHDTIDGTSMATPHVAGLAALLWAYNPSYTLSDVVSSIKNGGTTAASLAAKSTTGNAVSAWGSVQYVNTPTGLSGSVR